MASPRRNVGPHPSNRGAKPRTSREEILSTALALLDAEGPGAVNLRRLSRELGLTPMALYGYFDNKEDLITAVIAEALPSLSGEVDVAAPWQDQLAEVMCQIHHAFTAHPRALDLLLSRTDPDLDPIRETLIRILRSAGTDSFQAISFLTMLTSFAIGAVVISYRRGNPSDEVDRMRGLPSSTYPHLRETALQYAHRGDTETFDHSLRTLISAIEATLDHRR
jgi:AcrR family transcriptional regulator